MEGLFNYNTEKPARLLVVRDNFPVLINNNKPRLLNPGIVISNSPDVYSPAILINVDEIGRAHV